MEDEERFEEAASVYRRALELKPENAILRFDLGNTLFQLGRVEESRREFREAVRYDSDFAMAWHNLGSVNAALGEWSEAENALCTALSLVPTFADSHLTLSEVLRNLGRHAEATRHERAYREFSQQERLLASREQLLRIVGDEVDDRISS